MNGISNHKIGNHKSADNGIISLSQTECVRVHECQMVRFASYSQIMAPRFHIFYMPLRRFMENTSLSIL